jgi:hypothetical protein
MPLKALKKQCEYYDPKKKISPGQHNCENTLRRDISKPLGIFPDRQGIFPDRQGIISDRQGIFPDRQGIIPDRQGIIPDRQGILPDCYLFSCKTAHYLFTRQI